MMFTDDEKGVLFRLSRRLVLLCNNGDFSLNRCLWSHLSLRAGGLNERFNVTISKGGIAKIIAKWNQLSDNEEQYRNKC